MLIIIHANVLTVGLNGKDQALRQMPIRLITMESGKKAARLLKEEKIDGVVSNWNLDDMPDGLFLKRLKSVKPDIPTIALIESGNVSEEIAARSLGVSAVITDQADDQFFRQTLANVLGLKSVVSISSISASEESYDDYAVIREK